MVLCAIWYHLSNLKNAKNTHGGVLIIVKLQTLLKCTLLHGFMSRFLNCTNSNKSLNVPHISNSSEVKESYPGICDDVAGNLDLRAIRE